MTTPKVSVIMSVFNGERFLRDSVLSIFDQTFKDFEFIVVNDGSTDNSLKILNDFQKIDSRIKIISNEKNLGLTKSLNVAIRESKGEYLARLDAGDLSLPERIEKQVTFLDKNPDIGLVGSFMHIIDVNGKILKEIKYPIGDKQLKKDLIKYNPFVHSSIMFRREVGAKIGFYSEDYIYTQDYNLYFKLFPYTQFANIPISLVKYRKYSNSITSTKNRQQMSFANKARIYAIRQGYYGKFSYIYVLKHYLISLIPTKIKFFIKDLI